MSTCSRPTTVRQPALYLLASQHGCSGLGPAAQPGHPSLYTRRVHRWNGQLLQQQPCALSGLPPSMTCMSTTFPLGTRPSSRCLWPMLPAKRYRSRATHAAGQAPTLLVVVDLTLHALPVQLRVQQAALHRTGASLWPQLLPYLPAYSVLGPHSGTPKQIHRSQAWPDVQHRGRGDAQQLASGTSNSTASAPQLCALVMAAECRRACSAASLLEQLRAQSHRSGL